MNTTDKTLNESLRQAEAKLAFKEFDFPSRLPVLGPAIQKVRRAFNNISTRWYVNFFQQQQTEFNSALLSALRTLEQTNLRQEQKIIALEQELQLLQSGFHFRPGSMDRDIFLMINDPASNEYHLPDHFRPTDVIFDIGMHIGSFSHACLNRGAGQLYGFEPLKENFELACRNLNRFAGQIHLHNKAVWRSDRVGERLRFNPSTDETNTGGGTVAFGLGELEMETVSLDEMLDEVPSVRLLKIDCEGSEYPILFTSTLLHKVQAICGEFHEIGGTYHPGEIPPVSRLDGYEQYTIAELKTFLEKQGFKVEWERDGQIGFGKFWATRD